MSLLTQGQAAAVYEAMRSLNAVGGRVRVEFQKGHTRVSVYENEEGAVVVSRDGPAQGGEVYGSQFAFADFYRTRLQGLKPHVHQRAALRALLAPGMVVLP